MRIACGAVVLAACEPAAEPRAGADASAVTNTVERRGPIPATPPPGAAWARGDFHPEAGMWVSRTSSDGAPVFSCRFNARLAKDALDGGAPGAVARAARALDGVLACQNTQDGHPHDGAWRWARDDRVVEDLNGAQFVLEQLIPLLMDHGATLDEDLKQRLDAAVRRGLRELLSVDVAVYYSNVAAMDIVNLILGGQYLGDRAIFARGVRKLHQLTWFTFYNGTTFEYNSPQYTPIVLRAMHEVRERVADPDTAALATLLWERVALSVALRIHRGSGRWAGPHSRAFRRNFYPDEPVHRLQLQALLDAGALPVWFADVIDMAPAPFQVVEGAHRDDDVMLSTYHSASYAVGAATGPGIRGQENGLIAHFISAGDAPHDTNKAGVMYARLTTSTPYDAAVLTQGDQASKLEAEQGRFTAVQDDGQVIFLYSVKDEAFGVAQVEVHWRTPAETPQVWVNGDAIATFPAEMGDADVLTIATDTTLFALRPLSRRRLGDETTLRLEREGELLSLIMPLYDGPQKMFWELVNPGPFFQGLAHAGFLVDTAERADYATVEDFIAATRAAHITETIAGPFTGIGDQPRPWRIDYQRGEDQLGMELDLMSWTVRERWSENGPVELPQLSAPFAAQSRGGVVQVGGARLEAPGRDAWVVALDDAESWFGGVYRREPGPVTLTTPRGTVSIASMGSGVVRWRDGEVRVMAAAQDAPPVVTRR